MVRHAAVAGYFYPGSREALNHSLDALIPASAGRRPAFGLMAPHAGYLYSGGVAGRTFSRVEIPAEVVILGPNHRGGGEPLALHPPGSWETPLGEVPVGRSLTEAIAECCPQVHIDSQVHLREHSLEVQVPFLQALRPDVTIAALCVSHVALTRLLEVGDDLARAMKSRPRLPLLVASTDMTHYESGEAAREKDSLALEYILGLDPAGLYHIVAARGISMCGVLPTVVMLRAALALGASRAELVAYANSGEVTGDQREVVGYAGVVISCPARSCHCRTIQL